MSTRKPPAPDARRCSASRRTRAPGRMRPIGMAVLCLTMPMIALGGGTAHADVSRPSDPAKFPFGTGLGLVEYSATVAVEDEQLVDASWNVNDTAKNWRVKVTCLTVHGTVDTYIDLQVQSVAGDRSSAVLHGTTPTDLWGIAECSAIVSSPVGDKAPDQPNMTLYASGTGLGFRVDATIEDATPVAWPDIWSVSPGVTFTVLGDKGVLANDYDADGDPLPIAEQRSSPAKGTLSFRSDGGFDYTPNADAKGWDSFQYRACTKSGTCSDDTPVNFWLG